MNDTEEISAELRPIVKLTTWSIIMFYLFVAVYLILKRYM